METKSFNPDQIRKSKAIEKFVSIFKGTYEKLSPTDVDFKVFDKDGKLIAYIDVIPTLKNISRAYPLKISLEEMTKLFRKRLNPTIVWACDDGIVYGKLKDIVGEVRHVTVSDELIVYFDKQKSFKYVRYV
jgi:hypothetical protein